MFIVDLLISALHYIWQLFTEWLGLFAAPVLNTELLWISIPIWANWIFAEFFQEKRGTSFGNAISNGVVPLFVGIDWMRYLTNSLESMYEVNWWVVGLKYAICGIVMLYGLIIIILGISGHQMTRHIGRIREVTYVLLVFTPVIYGIIDLSWSFLIEIIVFFALWYYVIEWIDRKLPDPKAIELDKQSNQPQPRAMWGPPRYPMQRYR